MLFGLDKIPEDRFLAQCLARLKPVQTVHEDETLAIATDLDWGRLPDLKHTFGNLSHSVRPKRRAALYRHVDFRDRQPFASHHGPAPLSTACEKRHELR
jgi:hypothetical protein